jgi:hypothetical protein
MKIAAVVADQKNESNKHAKVDSRSVLSNSQESELHPLEISVSVVVGWRRRLSCGAVDFSGT